MKIRQVCSFAALTTAAVLATVATACGGTGRETANEEVASDIKITIPASVELPYSSYTFSPVPDGGITEETFVATAHLTFPAFTITGPNAANFTAIASPCTASKTEPNGENCPVLVEFAPDGISGTFTATLVATGGAATASMALTATATVNHSVYGTVSGLGGSGLALSDGTSSTTVAPRGTMFGFPKSLTSGQTYNVTVTEQPSSPTQTCTVTNGSGTVEATDVSNIVVTCTPAFVCTPGTCQDAG